MQEPTKCPRCKATMELKGEVEGSSQEGSITFLQCPNCKNIQIYARQRELDLRMDYP